MSDPENTLLLELEGGTVTIKLRPDLGLLGGRREPVVDPRRRRGLRCLLTANAPARGDAAELGKRGRRGRQGERQGERGEAPGLPPKGPAG